MKSSKFRFLLRGAFSLALIALLLSRLHWGEVSRLFRGLRGGPFWQGFALAVASEWLMAERVRLTLRHWSVRLTRATAASATWVGQFCNNFLPGGLGGDMVKFYRIGRLFPHARAATLVGLIADRLLALAALVTLSAAALSLGDPRTLRLLVSGAALSAGRARLPAWWVTSLVVAACGVFVAALVWRYRSALVEHGARHLRSVQEALRQGGRPGGTLLAAFLLAALVHSTSMLSACCFARALAIPLSVAQTFLVWPVVILAMMMPISVNGHGLREFVLLYYFDRWHLTSHLAQGAGAKESVVALSLLVVVTDLVCNLPGGILLLAGGGRAARQPAPGANAPGGDSAP